MAAWFKVRQDGLDVIVRLTPRAARDAVEGLGTASDGSQHLVARVRTVPEKGEANMALERLLAQRLGLPASAVSVISGSTSRLKTVRLSGNPESLAEKLDAAIRLGSRSKAD